MIIVYINIQNNIIMNKCFIFEMYPDNSFKHGLNESQIGVPEGMMRVTGVAAVLGTTNRNNRIYSEENYLKHINLLQDDISQGLYGELEHPEGFTINNNNISHKVEKLWYNAATKEVMITILLLDTIKGKIAQSIIKSGGAVKVSSRAMGSVDNNRNATIDHLVTYDIVGTPGFKQSSLYMTEHLKPLKSSGLMESFYLPIDSVKLNEQTQNISTSNTNLSLLEQALKDDRLNNILNTEIKKVFSADVLPIFHNWLTETLLPEFENYLNNGGNTKNKSFIDYMKK